MTDANSAEPTPPSTPSQTSLSENRGLIRAALLLSIGNIVSRLLGLIREIVKANLFGTTGAVSAFTIATFVPTSIFQLIVGGEMVNSALIPVFSEYAADESAEKRQELWQVVSMFLSVVIFILSFFVLLIILFAPWIATLQGANEFDDPALRDLSIRWMRISAPAVLFLSLASFISGVLYALKRFTYPAFVTATLNIAFITCAYFWGEVEGLVWGLLIGSALQVLIQLPGLRDAHLRWNLNWKHPAIRRILILYAPIVVGLMVTKVSEAASFRLATRLADQSVAFMGYATTLYQFPQGLVATALAIAILPTLSRQALLVSKVEYKETMAGGLRLVLGLILPASFGLFALATPVVALLFETGEFTAADTATVSLMLRYYLIGLPFAAFDLMLVSASYARKDTWRPALVGVLSLGFYWVAALSLIDSMGLLSLMVADAVKQIAHVIMMLFVLKRHVGGLGGYDVLPTFIKATIGSVATAAAAWGVVSFIGRNPPLAGFAGEVLVVAAAGVVGVAVYLGFVFLLNISEVKMLLKLKR